jgi:hypothetical protein
MNHSEQIGDLIAALSKAQGEMTFAKKDSENPFFKSTYSDLASIWEAIRAPLTHNALAVTQTLEHTDDGLIAVDTLLAHASGQWVRGRMAARPGKEDVQAAGSCCTYLRRYSLAAICGIAPSDSDDDGEAAMARNENNAKAAPARKPPTRSNGQKPDAEATKKAAALRDITAADKWPALCELADRIKASSFSGPVAVELTGQLVQKMFDKMATQLETETSAETLDKMEKLAGAYFDAARQKVATGLIAARRAELDKFDETAAPA